jgi:GNAT superfamily N-acetyltransferase
VELSKRTGDILGKDDLRIRIYEGIEDHYLGKSSWFGKVWRGEAPVAMSMIMLRTGLPIAALRLFDISLRNLTVTLPAVGVGGVYVIENMRGKRYGTRLMEFLIGLHDEGMLPRPVIVLYSRERSLYQRAGFVQVNPRNEHGPLWTRGLEGFEFHSSAFWKTDPDAHF